MTIASQHRNQTEFSPKDLEQISRIGKTPREVLRELSLLGKESSAVRLGRACRLGDGVLSMGQQDVQVLRKLYVQEQEKGRISKFVPASGAATRMFREPIHFFQNEILDRRQLLALRREGDSDTIEFLKLIDGLPRLALFPGLQRKMRERGFSLERLLKQGSYSPVMETLLEASGLSYRSLPKGLIPFHRYSDGVRTAFQEHVYEAIPYVTDREGTVRIHFTVAGEHLATVRSHLAETIQQESLRKRAVKISLSLQDPSTNTVAADLQGRPFRTTDGRILFRPGGHGSLLKNLAELNGDIVFLRNIDNISYQAAGPEKFDHRELLGGLLIQLQQKIFFFISRLSEKGLDKSGLEEAENFLDAHFSYGRSSKASLSERRHALFRQLNRPIRVCGVIRNQGQPGGGPFWTCGEDGRSRPQIVESSEVDFNSEEQKSIWKDSRYFNPVDMVCGIRDFQGRSFDLFRFRDPEAVFVSQKSEGARALKALELPGLWNGSMAYWNTVFVEIPDFTFTPVKAVCDLLERGHCGPS